MGYDIYVNAAHSAAGAKTGSNILLNFAGMEAIERARFLHMQKVKEERVFTSAEGERHVFSWNVVWTEEKNDHVMTKKKDKREFFGISRWSTKQTRRVWIRVEEAVNLFVTVFWYEPPVKWSRKFS